MSKYMSHKPRFPPVLNFANGEFQTAQIPSNSSPFISHSSISTQNRSLSQIHAMTSLFKKQKIAQNKRKKLEKEHSKSVYQEQVPNKLALALNIASKPYTKNTE